MLLLILSSGVEVVVAVALVVVCAKELPILNDNKQQVKSKFFIIKY
jgi:hypothetical protein